jgi:hypothetical protein
MRAGRGRRGHGRASLRLAHIGAVEQMFGAVGQVRRRGRQRLVSILNYRTGDQPGALTSEVSRHDGPFWLRRKRLQPRKTRRNDVRVIALRAA